MNQYTIFHDMVKHPAALQLVLNAMSVGETNSGQDLHRVADLIPDPDLKRRVLKHYADEMKHGKIFGGRLQEIGGKLEPLPADLDYEEALHRYSFGLLRERLKEDQPLSDDDLIKFFAGARVTEATAISDLEMARKGFEVDPPTERVLAEVLKDEYNHVAYATEELERLAGRGHGPRINALLAEYERLEAQARRDISRAFMTRMLPILEYSLPLRVAIRIGIEVEYFWRRLFPKKHDIRAKAPALAGTAAQA
ncbi:MAG: ferritin-like domain-containing protein [Planctomycetes bacterium]|nr:ferritin-like domain-containing protein [Planctomycetota bacterium]